DQQPERARDPLRIHFGRRCARVAHRAHRSSVRSGGRRLRGGDGRDTRRSVVARYDRPPTAPARSWPCRPRHSLRTRAFVRGPALGRRDSRTPAGQMAASSPNVLSGDDVRILLLSPFTFYPPRHGTGARIYHLARALQARHTVTVVYFDRPERLRSSAPVERLDTVGLPLAEHKPTRWIRWSSRFGLLGATPVSATNLATLREVIASRSIDVVVCQDLVLAPLLPVLTARPLVWAT